MPCLMDVSKGISEPNSCLADARDASQVEPHARPMATASILDVGWTDVRGYKGKPYRRDASALSRNGAVVRPLRCSSLSSLLHHSSPNDLDFVHRTIFTVCLH